METLIDRLIAARVDAIEEWQGAQADAMAGHDLDDTLKEITRVWRDICRQVDQAPESRRELHMQWFAGQNIYCRLRTMAEGEVLQLTRSFDPDVPESVYLDVIGRKTSCLLAMCAEAGAILGGVTRAERPALRDFGWELGVAFQLVDDALDYAGASEELGKAPFTDLAEGKVTMPLIATLKRCTVGERAAIAAALKACALRSARAEEAPAEETATVVELVRRYNGAEITLARARQCVDRARARIGPFSEPEWKRALFDLAEFVVQRSR